MKIMGRRIKRNAQYPLDVGEVKYPETLLGAIEQEFLDPNNVLASAVFERAQEALSEGLSPYKAMRKAVRKWLAKDQDSLFEEWLARMLAHGNCAMIKPTTLTFVFSRTLSTNVDEFGDAKSCFRTFNAHHKVRLNEHGGYVIKLFHDGKPYGRCLAMHGRNGLVLFNLYFSSGAVSFPMKTLARAFAKFFGKSGVQTTGIPEDFGIYLNDGVAYLIGEEFAPRQVNTGHELCPNCKSLVHFTNLLDDNGCKLCLTPKPCCQCGKKHHDLYNGYCPKCFDIVGFHFRGHKYLKAEGRQVVLYDTPSTTWIPNIATCETLPHPDGRGELFQLANGGKVFYASEPHSGSQCFVFDKSWNVLRTPDDENWDSETHEALPSDQWVSTGRYLDTYIPILPEGHILRRDAQFRTITCRGTSVRVGFQEACIHPTTGDVLYRHPERDFWVAIDGDNYVYYDLAFERTTTPAFARHTIRAWMYLVAGAAETTIYNRQLYSPPYPVAPLDFDDDE